MFEELTNEQQIVVEEALRNYMRGGRGDDISGTVQPMLEEL